MLLFYIDEFGDSELKRQRAHRGLPWSLKPGVSDWFVLSAVGIPESTRLDLAGRVQDLKATHFGKSWATRPWKDTEIKGRFLRMAGERLQRGKQPIHPFGYQRLSSMRHLEALCQDLGNLWRLFRPITYVVAIDKKRLIQRKYQRRTIR